MDRRRSDDTPSLGRNLYGAPALIGEIEIDVSSLLGESLRAAVGLNPALFYAGVFPQLTGDLVRIDAGRPPPRSLVAGAMDRSVMRAAQRDREFIAGPAAERTRLQVAKMMRVGWPAAADETRLFGDVAKMLSIAIAPRRGNG